MSTLRSLRRKKIRESQDRLKKKVQADLSGQQVVVRQTQGEKMSEVLLDFVRPHLDLAQNDEQQRKAIALAVLAWNVALLPPEKHAEEIDQIVSGFPDVAEEMRTLMQAMVQRKLMLFPDHRRVILNYEIADLGGSQLHLSVISTSPGHTG